MLLQIIRFQYLVETPERVEAMETLEWDVGEN